ncbi:MAG: anion transporter [Candidatus Krumholzibacteria bacterium]|nr:anion transporter [Candidatus Krumholzibacteria bacterium]
MSTDLVVLVVFAFVYAGMILGRIPGLALDRTGVALLGAIVLVTLGRVTVAQLSTVIDIPTIALLFGLMVVSAQFRMSGFYSWLVHRIAAVEASPGGLLALLILIVGALSALLANDIVCLAVTPVLVEGCARRRLDPKPYLLALACAANVGSAATLIGNPQNMLIGQVLRLSFGRYLLEAGVPAFLGLFVVWGVVYLHQRGRWSLEMEIPPIEAMSLDTWQTVKGAAVLAITVVAFLATPWPRELVALAAAGYFLCSRRMKSREILGLVDWQLLLLFMSLFIVNHALSASGSMEAFTGRLASRGIHLERPAWLFGVSVILSNLVSNVPAVMLLLPSASHPLAGPILALSSTLAGNLFIVGSIANIIVVDQAGRLGVAISWREHAKIGVPVTVITLAIAAGWLALMSF